MDYSLHLIGQEGLYAGLELLAKARFVKESTNSSPVVMQHRNDAPIRGQRITVITGYLTSSLATKVLQMVNDGVALDLWHAGELAKDTTSEMLARLNSRGINVVSLLQYTTPQLKTGIGGNKHVIA
ncbi:hypothetical protein D3C77_524660 [compost metagenome]